jgi:hypothetical protein
MEWKRIEGEENNNRGVKKKEGEKEDRRGERL